jgi:hypothetical protein
MKPVKSQPTFRRQHITSTSKIKPRKYKERSEDERVKSLRNAGSLSTDYTVLMSEKRELSVVIFINKYFPIYDPLIPVTFGNTHLNTLVSGSYFVHGRVARMKGWRRDKLDSLRT